MKNSKIAVCLVHFDEQLGAKERKGGKKEGRKGVRREERGTEESSSF